MKYTWDGRGDKGLGGLMRESVDLYLRQKPKRSTYFYRRLLVTCVLLVTLVWLIVVLSSWRAASADGPGISPSSLAPSSASPRIQRVPDASTGVYLGCQELAPASDLPASGR